MEVFFIKALKNNFFLEIVKFIFNILEGSSNVYISDMNASTSFIRDIEGLNLEEYYISKKISVVDRINNSVKKLEEERQAKLMVIKHSHFFLKKKFRIKEKLAKSLRLKENTALTLFFYNLKKLLSSGKELKIAF